MHGAAQQLDGADPASRVSGFGAILGLAGRAAHLEAVGRLGIITKSKEGNIDYFSNNSEATRLDGFH